MSSSILKSKTDNKLLWGSHVWAECGTNGENLAPLSTDISTLSNCKIPIAQRGAAIAHSVKVHKTLHSDNLTIEKWALLYRELLEDNIFRPPWSRGKTFHPETIAETP